MFKQWIEDHKIVEVKNDIVRWIREYMARNASADTPIIIGISGGKDSSVTAALCVQAVGKENVIGVLMPNGIQKDIDISREFVEYLGIKSYEVNIKGIADMMDDDLYTATGLYVNDIYMWNTPARIRMMVLYGIANILGGRVANTCNFTESRLGYDTKFGDQCGDFAPIADIYCTDVVKIGKACCLPSKFVDKAPDDGMCGKTDEERFGFTYAMAENYFSGRSVPMDVTRKIEQMAEKARHKSCIFIPTYRCRENIDYYCCCT